MASNYNQRFKPAEVAIYTDEYGTNSANLSSKQIVDDGLKNANGDGDKNANEKKNEKKTKIFKDKLIKERENLDDLLKGQIGV